MITYEKLKNNSQLFKSFTGMTLTAFLALLLAFRRACEDDLDRRDAQREQPRNGGAACCLSFVAKSMRIGVHSTCGAKGHFGVFSPGIVVNREMKSL